MGIFQRIFSVGKAEAHAAIDHLEDPIKMTEQGIRDLKKDLNSAMTSLAEVKGLAIRLKKEKEDNKKAAADYDRKAMLLLQKAEKGEIDSAEADRLATESLNRKEESENRAVSLTKDWQQQETTAANLHGQVEKLKSTIASYDNDLVTLRARARTAAATKKINRQLARVDSSGTLAMLEKMKDRVAKDESLSQAYGEIASSERSVEDEIDAALAGTDNKGADKLAELKAKMGGGK